MIKKSSSLITLLFFCCIGTVHALIAPLSKDVLQEKAHQILVGKIIAITQKEETRPYGIDLVYTVKMSVDSIEKGEHPATNTIAFTYWKSKKRFKGWAGNFGQNSNIKPNSIIRVYLSKTPEGELTLLEPNGWEKI
jgi:hypothetical protein